MRNNALYFPYIEVPDEVWTTRVLLYWDKLSSIVPMDYIDEPSLLSDNMKSLVHEGLVEQIIPSHYLHRLDGFEANFIRYIEHRLSRMRKSSGKWKKVRIHIEKLGNLPNFLVENGLAEKDRGPWYNVEYWVANAFMAYLATSLGGIDEINAAPITNDVNVSRLFGEFRKSKSIEREVLLGKLLPIPKGKPSLSSLIAFKEKHGHLLPPFRERIELLSSELGSIQDIQQRRARAEVIVNELEGSVREIESAMKVSWKHTTFGTFMPLLGAGGSFYATDPSLQIVAASAAGITFIDTVCKTINDYRVREQSISNNPLAYLAYARHNVIHRSK